MTLQDFNQANEQIRQLRIDALASEETAFEKGLELTALQQQEKALSDQCLADICATTNDAGKPAFSNSEARSAELAIRLTNSPEWRRNQDAQAALGTEIRTLRSQTALKKIDTDFLRSQIDYANTHAAEEINDLLTDISGRVTAFTQQAAKTAVAAAFAALARANQD